MGDVLFSLFAAVILSGPLLWVVWEVYRDDER